MTHIASLRVRHRRQKVGHAQNIYDDLLCFYKSVILSVLDYGSVVWHHHLTRAQSDQFEALQKRAVRIILHLSHYHRKLPLDI